MTASSVEFFPCRVQLMGLPRSASSSAAAATGAAPTTSLQQTPPRRPPMEKVQGVSRNLFGSPEPGEINHMFQQETRRQHSYVFERYNIDMKLLTASPATQPKVVSSVNHRQEQPTQQSQLPTLIARELKQHEQRLQKEECNLNRPNEVTPPNAKIQQLQSCGGVSKIVRRCCNDEALTPPSSTTASGSVTALISSNMERQKPYSRQSLLTESFNLRKNKICGPVSSTGSPLSSIKQRHPLNATAKQLSIETTPLQDSHRTVQVLQMPQALQAEMTLIDTVANNTTVTPATTPDTFQLDHNDEVSHYTEDEQHTDDFTSGSSSAESSPRPTGNTTFSLKLVLSAQNAAVTTTSSASRENAHHA